MSFYNGVGRHHNLRAELSARGRVWRLRVILVVQVVFVSHENDRHWEPRERGPWREALTTSAEATWSHKWFIEAAAGNPVVEVTVDLIDATDSAPPEGAHLLQIFVFRDDTAYEREVGTHYTPGRDEHISVREGDVRMQHRTLSDRSHVFQRGTDHEIGHALGLNHPLCDANSLACYGDWGTTAGGDVMGRGGTVSRLDYEVFSEILNFIAPGHDWRVGESWRPGGPARFQQFAPWRRGSRHGRLPRNHDREQEMRQALRRRIRRP